MRPTEFFDFTSHTYRSAHVDRHRQDRHFARRSSMAPSQTRAVSRALPAGEVDNLVVQLKAGALAVPLEVVQSRAVGPSLGQDSIDKSLIAAIVGLGIVALFMILYYRVPGFLSVLAL